MTLPPETRERLRSASVYHRQVSLSGGCPGQWGMVRSALTLHPLWVPVAFPRLSQMWQPEMSPDFPNVPWGKERGRISQAENWPRGRDNQKQARTCCSNQLVSFYQLYQKRGRSSARGEKKVCFVVSGKVLDPFCGGQERRVTRENKTVWVWEIVSSLRGLKSSICPLMGSPGKSIQSNLSLKRTLTDR